MRWGLATSRLAARLVIGVVVPLLGVTWLVGDKSVTLRVDGRVRTVQTHATTVGEVLDRAGVPHGAKDALRPAAGTSLVDGMTVELVHARRITLLIGGRQRSVLVTALRVDDVLKQLADRIELTSRSTVRPSRDTRITPGMTVEVTTPVPVTVVHRGRRDEIITDARTVAAVLERLGLRLDDNDRVDPPRPSDVEAGMTIVVSDVEVKTRRRELAIAFDTQWRRSPDLPRGESRELQSGSDGVLQIVERVVLVDGVEESRRRAGEQVLRQPQTRIVAVGTADPVSETPQPQPTVAEPSPATAAPEPPPATPPASEPPEQAQPRPQAAPQREAAPAAEPEPEPEPETAPAPEPRPAPRPQPAPSRESSEQRSDSGDASYYNHPDPDAYTAAHRTLPFGTVVTVTNLDNGRSVQVTVNDRGPYVEGRVIDLNKPAFREIASLDSGVIPVRIEW